MRDPLLSTDQIIQAFADEARPIDALQAQRLAHELQSYGGLSPAIAALAEDQASGLLADALRLKSLLAERADPALKHARLLRDARDLDARAGPAWAEAADCRGRAAFRRQRGELDLAAALLAQALAAERLAGRFEDEALHKRLRAAGLKAGLDLMEALRDLAA